MVFLNYLLTLLIFTLVILAVGEIGSLFLKIFKFNFPERLEKKILAEGIGLGFLAIYIFLIGLGGYLKIFFIWLPMAVFIFLALWHFKLPKFRSQNFDKIERLLLLIFVGFLIVNLIGVFAPEIGFDALYYHLTLPKIYFMKGKILSLGGLFDHVSPWPKLTEMLYLLGISLNNSSLARLFHFYFGLMTAVLIFLFSQKLLSKKVGVLAALAFYSIPTVSWFSTSGYVDLATTFYITLASCLIFLLPNNKKNNLLIGLFYGFALGTKLLALPYLPGFLLVFFLRDKLPINKKAQNIFFILVGLLITAWPWYFVSYLWTGNPTYPFFQPAKSGPVGAEVLSDSWYNRFLRYSRNFNRAFFKPDDFLTPLPLIFLPLTIFYFNKLKREMKFLGLLLLSYSLVLIVLSHGSNRYLLPLFPLFIVFSFAFFTQTKQLFLKKYLIVLTIFISGFCLLYRATAVLPRIKVFLGLEKQSEFLTRHFPKEELVFIDKEGFFRSLVVGKEKPVLIIGSHQFFYVNFPFEHISWAPKDKIYSYILIQERELPEGLGELPLVYEDESNNIKLYKFGKSLK